MNVSDPQSSCSAVLVRTQTERKKVGGGWDFTYLTRIFGARAVGTQEDVALAQLAFLQNSL